MVGLDRAGRDQCVCTLSQRIGGQVFKLAHLVAAQRERGGVITLNVNIAICPERQALKLFQSRRRADQVQAIEAGKLIFDHGDK